MSVQLRELAARQADVVAAWQLVRAGWTVRMVDHWRNANGWRVIHPGVYVLTRSPLTRRQRWFAATLTTPRSVLSHASAAACHGFRSGGGGRSEVITRPGSGRVTSHPGLVVHRSLLLDGDVTRRDGLLITTPERTMLDNAVGLPDAAVARMFREALRLRTTTVRRTQSVLDRHRGRRGTRVLRELAARYATIPYERARSDAEARALELLHDANVEPPRVNWVIGGEMADLVWLDRRLIVEIDGPQFHRFADEDARKTRIWERAGFTVSRLPSGEVYARPELLIAVAARRTDI